MEKLPSDYPLSNRQYELLRDVLVKTASWTMGNNDLGKLKNNESVLLDKLEEVLEQVAPVTRVPERENLERPDPFFRKGVYAEKGTLENPAFTALLYAHIDTVYPDGFPHEWQDPLALKRDGDKLSGLGVYDMKAGAMAAIDVFRETDVPPGVRLMIGLCHDEESDSRGALDLAAWLKKTGKVPDVILSPEIATLPQERQESDHPKKDVIVNRIGHVKSLFKLNVPQAHRFKPSAPDAGEELYFAFAHMKRLAHERAAHPFFGKQYNGDFDYQELHVPRADGFSKKSSASMRLSYLTVPGDSVQSILDWEKARIEDCAKMRNWTRKKVRTTFCQTPHETSYEPYSIDIHSDVSQMVLSSVDAVYGGHKLKGGGSTSDANIFQAAFPDVPCFDIGAVGANAHHREEWVSAASIAKNIEWMRHVITRAIPDLLAARK